MKPSSFCLALGAAQVALSAPLPPIFVDRLGDFPDPAAHQRLSTAAPTLARATTYWVREPDSDDTSNSITRPILSPPPLLPPLSRHRQGSSSSSSAPSPLKAAAPAAAEARLYDPRPRPSPPPFHHRKIDLIPVRITVNDAGDASTHVVDLGVPAEWLASSSSDRGSMQHHRHPHSRHAGGAGGVSRERNEVLVVWLVAAFVVVVVLMETWKSILRSFRGQGAIRLEEDTTIASTLPAVSVRANPPSGHDESGDEKRRI